MNTTLTSTTAMHRVPLKNQIDRKPNRATLIAALPDPAQTALAKLISVILASEQVTHASVKANWFEQLTPEERRHTGEWLNVIEQYCR